MNGWKTVKLKEVTTIERSSVQPEQIENGTVYVGLEHIESGGSLVGIEHVDAGVLASTKFQFTEHHVLYGKLRPYLAKIACPEFSGICSTDILPILPGPKIERRYLFHFLRQPSMIDYASSLAVGANLPRLSPSVLEEFRIPLPPLEEQKRISDILDRAEALRAKRRAALDQLDELTQSIFNEMFGNPLKNPMGWSTINLEDTCNIITDGEHATPKRTESGIYLLSARNIKNHSLSLGDVDFIDKDEYDRISKRIIPQKGDILVSCSGTIGRVAQVKECFKFQLVRSVALLRPETSKINPTYLEYNFDSIYLKKQIEKSVNQSSQANLFQGKIRKLKIPLPPLEIQDKFAELAGQLEKIKQSQQQSLLEINNLFDSLSHEAFTGKLFSHQFFEREIKNGVKI